MQASHTLRLPTIGVEREPLKTDARLYAYYNMPFARPQKIPRTVRTIVIRLVISKMAVTGVLCLLGFLATDSLEKKFLTALSVVINGVAAFHYYSILRIRDQDVPHWMRLKGKQEVRAFPVEEDKELHDPMTNDERFQLQEMIVDVLRHSDWLITLCFLTWKLYTIFGRTGNLFNGSVEWAVFCVVAMVVLGLVVRIGTDEIAPRYERDEEGRMRRLCNGLETGIFLLGCLAFLIATFLMVFVLIDMSQASYDIPDSGTLRSFYFVWIGYPVVSLLSILFRQCASADGQNGYSEGLSFFKDVCFAGLDVYSKSIFALWTAFSAFEQPLGGHIPNSMPHVWPPPPSSPPPASL